VKRPLVRKGDDGGTFYGFFDPGFVINKVDYSAMNDADKAAYIADHVRWVASEDTEGVGSLVEVYALDDEANPDAAQPAIFTSEGQLVTAGEGGGEVAGQAMVVNERQADFVLSTLKPAA
jgi:hypothetical protein